MGAVVSAMLVDIGDKLGLYRAMADGEPVTSAQLAERTGTAERYVREWLSNQAAGGYVEYDAQSSTFRLPPEQALALAEEGSPVFVPGAFQLFASLFRDEGKILEAFRTGKGVGWHEHDPELFTGTERFFRPGYNANLVGSWIPALEGVDAKLRRGARVADVGCGLGASTIIMAQAYPSSSFAGFDYHARSIELARERANEAGVAGQVTFEVASAKEFPGSDYDLVTFFDSLHDMGDPVGAAEHVCQSLAPDGTWLLVEPLANDRLEDNLSPVGRVYYGASTMICTPASLSQEVGLALGA
jgi:2-polyprenyl-3-methyl-5-hydroxy-6-metoxy-1,4-benzoquinol methylase